MNRTLRLQVIVIVFLAAANVLFGQYEDCTKSEGYGSWLGQGYRSGCGGPSSCRWTECDTGYNDNCSRFQYCH